MATWNAIQNTGNLETGTARSLHSFLTATIKTDTSRSTSHSHYVIRKAISQQRRAESEAQWQTLDGSLLEHAEANSRRPLHLRGSQFRFHRRYLSAFSLLSREHTNR